HLNGRLARRNAFTTSTSLWTVAGLTKGIPFFPSCTAFAPPSYNNTLGELHGMTKAYIVLSFLMVPGSVPWPARRRRASDTSKNYACEIRRPRPRPRRPCKCVSTAWVLSSWMGGSRQSVEDNRCLLGKHALPPPSGPACQSTI